MNDEFQRKLLRPVTGAALAGGTGGDLNLGVLEGLEDGTHTAVSLLGRLGAIGVEEDAVPHHVPHLPPPLVRLDQPVQEMLRDLLPVLYPDTRQEIRIPSDIGQHKRALAHHVISPA